jgi:hypothetical protein
VLAQLTSYLFQYRKVHIPHIGSFHIRYTAARLDFADRKLYPPHYQVIFHEDDEPDRNQVQFLSVDGEDIITLNDFGKRMNENIIKNPFIWKGLGKLEYTDNRIIFHPETRKYPEPVEANKIIREREQHAVLVGETERHSGDTSYIKEEVVVKKSATMLTGWILVALAALFIIWHLYRNHFHVQATGSQVQAIEHKSSK